MHFSLLLALVALAANLGIDVYIYRRLRAHAVARRLHTGLSVLLSLLWICIICMPKRIGDDAFLARLMWGIYIYWSFYAAKYIGVFFDAVAAIPRLWHAKRARWVTATGIAAATALFGAMWWGALVDRFRLDIVEVDVPIEGLPDGLRGLRIVQISDWHVGTFGTDTAFVSRTVDSINALHPDLIVFTGDAVNRHSEEIVPFMGPMSRLHAPLGVYSIFGNHDYSSYYSWSSDSARVADVSRLHKLQRAMGWKVLANATAMLHVGGDSLALIGVENIGEPPFKSYGDLPRSYPTLADSTVKVLLSHNPMHWSTSIAGNDSCRIALTLAGHTHAMQIKVGGFSPAVWRYPTWGGMYDDGRGHMLYVNRGLGTVGLPMRIGATPEITVLTLR